jgi:hypothetical protein
MTHKLLIGSVFCPCDRNAEWLRLQLKFLKATTDDFVHAVFLNNVTAQLFKESIVIGSGNHDHPYGLNQLVGYARSMDYENLLLLDSDCFPIEQDWHNKLIAGMDKKHVAAPVRPENLDSFAHPCAYFIKREAFNKVRFQKGRIKNILGEEFEDCHSNINDFFPLLRTNAINLHPIMYAVYWNLFYHHGAGSRAKTFRSIGRYLPYDSNTNEIERQSFKRLSKEPEAFIDELRGSKLKLPPKKIII